MQNQKFAKISKNLNEIHIILEKIRAFFSTHSFQPARRKVPNLHEKN